MMTTTMKLILRVLILSSLPLALAAAAPAQTAPAPEPLVSQKAPGTENAGSQQKNNVDGRAFYQKWLNEDVRWIITDEELAAFKKLSKSADKDRFIEDFWKRR